MKWFVVTALCFPMMADAHPGIGIVADSRGNIFYTDLQHVWKISSGRKTIAVRDVHTHELFVDSADNLYGEHQWNDEGGRHFYHHYWRRTPDGRLDTVVGARAAFVRADFSLARDHRGNAYYLKPDDTSHIFRQSKTGREDILASGSFKNLKWLHPQMDGSVLYVLDNIVYRIDADGTARTVAKNIGSDKPSFAFTAGTNSIMVFGAWQDTVGNVYVACFSDAAVKKIDPAGVVSVAYKSTGKWAPTHGVFDNKGQLWVLECSDKNEMRAVQAGASKQVGVSTSEAPKKMGATYGIGLAALAIAGWILIYMRTRSRDNRAAT